MFHVLCIWNVISQDAVTWKRIHASNCTWNELACWQQGHELPKFAPPNTRMLQSDSIDYEYKINVALWTSIAVTHFHSVTCCATLSYLWVTLPKESRIQLVIQKMKKYYFHFCLNVIENRSQRAVHISSDKSCDCRSSSPDCRIVWDLNRLSNLYWTHLPSFSQCNHFNVLFVMTVILFIEFLHFLLE